MTGQEKYLREKPGGENWTNEAREESRSASHRTRSQLARFSMIVTPDRQDQLTTVPTPAGRPGQATCWTGEVQLDERLSFRALLARERVQGGDQSTFNVRGPQAVGSQRTTWGNSQFAQYYPRYIYIH